MTEDLDSPANGETVQKKNITIRGIDAEVYSKFSRKIKGMDLNIGEAVTKMMNGVIDNIEGDLEDAASTSIKKDITRIKVADQSRLFVSKHDLTEADHTYAFFHINYLKIEPDVDVETFLERVAVIQGCHTVVVPNFLTRLKLLSKIKFCTELEIYDVE